MTWSTWSQRMSVMTLKRSARTCRTAARPWTPRLALRHGGGARADPVGPGRQHHVLRAAPGVVLVALRLHERDDGRGAGQPPRVGAQRADRRQPRAVADDHEPVGLAVLGAAGH